MTIKNIQKYIELYNEEKILFEQVGNRAKKRGFLNFYEFYKICMWKSVRQKQNYLKNKDTVEKITKNAFNSDDEAEKMSYLCELKGVEIPVASAILTVVYPKKYAVIDKRCLDMLREKFNYKLNETITPNTWRDYLKIMREIADDNKITPRQLDMALFAMHKEKLENEDFKNLY